MNLNKISAFRTILILTSKGIEQLVNWILYRQKKKNHEIRKLKEKTQKLRTRRSDDASAVTPFNGTNRPAKAIRKIQNAAAAAGRREKPRETANLIHKIQIRIITIQKISEPNESFGNGFVSSKNSFPAEFNPQS